MSINYLSFNASDVQINNNIIIRTTTDIMIAKRLYLQRILWQQLLTMNENDRIRLSFSTMMTFFLRLLFFVVRSGCLYRRVQNNLVGLAQC